MKHLINICMALCFCAVLWPNEPASAQGVTTGVLAGVVTDAQQQPVAGASVIAVHLPSGTTYEGVTRADGRFQIPGMRVGGPYSVTVAYVGAGTAFEPTTQEDITIQLGTATDLQLTVRPIAVQETVTVTATSDMVFSSSRTGAATSVNREAIATLPTISGRIGDITRLTPQAAGMSFAGQDNRLNNITVDGSYFNNSFGLGDQPGARTGVAPISLEAIEQIQVSVAPFDVREGNFVGANVNTVTRSGTNKISASTYYRYRNNDFVGTEARGNAFNPGEFETKQFGVWGGAPIIKNRLFVFGNFEDEKDVRPLNTFRANRGEPIGGNITRVRADALDRLSAFLQQNFNYDTGPYEGINDETPNKRFLIRNDFNLNNSNKISFRYNQLDSRSDNNLSGSTSAGVGGRRTFTTDFLSFQASNYSILENIKSGIGEWNAILGGSMSNSLIVGYTTNDESRADPGELFPFVDIHDGNGVSMTAFGSEPFTPNNELYYRTFQMKDDFTKYGNHHTFTFGVTAQRYESDNVFFNCCKQGGYTYNTIDDFYTDALGALANPNRTTSPVTLRQYQIRYMNLPGLDKPIQPLRVWYGGGYAQDEWRPRQNLSILAGFRLDVPAFQNTAYRNERADALTFRDEDGQPVQYDSGKLPERKVHWSPRLGFNWDVFSDQRTQVRGGSGVFTGPPLYVWISNQLGNTGVLTGNDIIGNTIVRPFSRDINRYRPAPTGQPAPSYELNVTDADFKFPQLWRTNVAVDRRLPGGMTGTVEYIYNRDINGIYYINANLPAPQSAFAGPDNRPRWTANRINNATGNQVTSAIVFKNQSIGRSWNFATSVSKPTFVGALRGLSLRGAYSYGEAKNTIDPGSTAFASWASNSHAGDPNNPGLGFASASPGHRVYLQTSYSKQYFDFGSTTISMFWEARNGANSSYVFAGDMNGDGGSNSDLIYIPRDISEMNFVTFTCAVPTCRTAITFTAQQQAEAFEAYIQQDKYLRKHRGEYAQRGAVFLPFLKRADLSVTQDVFRNIAGRRNAGQFRIDITNFGNLLNSNWGVGQRLRNNQILTNTGVDAQGRVSYRLRVVDNELINRSFESTSGISDVYQFMLSFRYSFN